MRTLITEQEPAKLWWVVFDERDQEDGIFFGPVPSRQAAEAFIQGYEFALTTDDSRTLEALTDDE